MYALLRCITLLHTYKRKESQRRITREGERTRERKGERESTCQHARKRQNLCVCVCISLSLSLPPSLSLLFLCACVLARARARVCVCVREFCVCMCTCMYMYVYIYICIHPHTYSRKYISGCSNCGCLSALPRITASIRFIFRYCQHTYDRFTQFGCLFDIFITNLTDMHTMDTGWRRPIGCLKLHVIFRKRATNSGALLRRMTYND